MQRLFSLFAPLLTAALAAAALGGCDSKPRAADRAPDRPALVSIIHFAPQSRAREFTAAIRPRIESDLGFRVAGKVVRRLVEVGQRVKAGAILAALDDADLKLQKEQADAEYAASNVVQMQTTADETRAARLKQQGWTAQAALDRAHAAAQEARSRNQRAARAVELARNSLDYAVLRADADGVVTQTSIEPGQVVAAGAPAVRIARDGEMEAAVALPESYANAAGEGEARLFLWSRPDKTYRAKLRELSPSADPATRNFAARFSILDPDPAISLGMSATLVIAGRSETPAIGVPLSALFNQGEGAGLWRVDAEGGLSLIPVSVLRYEADRAIVSGPLEEGDKYVVLGVQKLDPAQRVRVIVQN
ncbi:efflux RND transporter periplasmic adaptor subunit [Methylocystis heyeri]|uniref:Efflux RND transporter periplasmic adaptor subunit n=1 Tax=Methylocystis heyeri TaxID=391905 RepID=A0A6B8KL14_9HYPH|nr:efflux RND transporter periplasmic adaptor subunit [Methylocystis heyeri]QGM47841.1 efflux RND transporter periplasmic adaptor subunit [Methylocystis heyeri]